MSEFSVILVSNASTDIYADNTPTLFTNSMPRALTLKGDWQVALQAISFDNNMNNVPLAGRTVSTAQFVLVVKGQNKIERQVPIKLMRTYYTPSIMQSLLQRTIPAMFSLNCVPTLTANNNLSIILQHCKLLIQETICEWMKIKSATRKTIILTDTSYIEFDATNQELSILSETVNFDGEDIPAFVKLQLKEMRPTLSGIGFHQDLAIVPYKTPTREDSYYYHEVKRKEFYSLTSNELQCLSVKLCGEDNRQLNLGFGQPTLVKLNFRNMYGSTSFQVRITSKDSNNIFPHNNASNFYVQLPHELLLPGNDWEVALSSFHYPTRIDPKPLLGGNKFWLKLIDPNILVQYQPPAFTFENDDITDGLSLINAINLKVRNQLADDNIFKVSITTRGNLLVEVGRVLTLQFSPLFSTVIGAGAELKDGCDFYEYKFEKARTLFPGLVKLERCLPHNMLLYCDIISPVIMSGKYCNILKVMQLQSVDPKTKVSSYVCNHLDFVDVASDRVQSIHFHLQTIAEETVGFLDVQEPSYVTVVFRKKERK